mmetsp:Transcript_108190/g.345528  ORF Transcript_108190/g.345528 Transcript_108190/m.345528 type:complete len:209 (+) Transcript_108190:552-1178(+)
MDVNPADGALLFFRGGLGLGPCLGGCLLGGCLLGLLLAQHGRLGIDHGLRDGVPDFRPWDLHTICEGRIQTILQGQHESFAHDLIMLRKHSVTDVLDGQLLQHRHQRREVSKPIDCRTHCGNHFDSFLNAKSPSASGAMVKMCLNKITPTVSTPRPATCFHVFSTIPISASVRGCKACSAISSSMSIKAASEPTTSLTSVAGAQHSFC